jgi:hypothetical protein
MKIGLQIPDFTWPGGPTRLGPTVARIVSTADSNGFDYIALMDHFFQIRGVGPAENDMLEGYTSLGFVAAHTERAKLLTLVTGAIYRYPAVLAKIVTTLDVLSGGRTVLGIGAGWNDEESRGLGIPFPSTGERFERLEDGDYDDIEKTVYHRFDTGTDGDRVPRIVDDLKGLADLGVHTAIGMLHDVHTITPIEVIGQQVIPAVAGF